MGYFSNGCESESYQAQYCDHCVHQKDGCAVWLAHLMKNYDDCNNDESLLHYLIPKSKNGLGNLKCKMFITKEAVRRMRKEHKAQQFLNLQTNEN